MSSFSDIKNYQSVSRYLADHYEWRKSRELDFSYTVWARELGVKNRAYVRLVAMGERPLNQRLIEAFIGYFRFEAGDALYFIDLVNYNQSKNSEQKKVFGKKILSSQKFAGEFNDVLNHYEFLSHPLLPRLLTLLSFDDAARDERMIARIMKCGDDEIAAACGRLRELGLVQRQEDGRWVPVKRSWRLPNSFNNLAYREFYEDSLERAKKAIDEFSPDERRFRSVFLAMGPGEFQSFLRDFESFLQEQMAKLNFDSLDGRRLYQLGFHFFPSSDAPTIEGARTGPEIKMNTFEGKSSSAEN